MSPLESKERAAAPPRLRLFFVCVRMEIHILMYILFFDNEYIVVRIIVFATASSQSCTGPAGPQGMKLGAHPRHALVFVARVGSHALCNRPFLLTSILSQVRGEKFH